MMMQNPVAVVAAFSAAWKLTLWGLLVVIVLVFLLDSSYFFKIWLRAKISVARVDFTEFIALRRRGVPVSLIVNSRITAAKSGILLIVDDLSKHYLAGRRLKYGQHLAFDRDNNCPLPNLFVTMLQGMGIETERFASSTGTRRELELELELS